MGMEGMRIRMRGIRSRNEGNQGGQSLYRSGIDELELWRGKKIKENVSIYKNIVWQFGMRHN